MNLFRRLISASNDSQGLSEFIFQNIQAFSRLQSSNLQVLSTEKLDIRDFIETKRLLLEELDYSSSANRAFISILFDFAERFGFLAIVAIENTLVRHELHLGERRQAAKLFLLNVRNNDDYVLRFTDICNLLQESYNVEEDNEKNVIATFLNYIAKVVRDTSPFYIDEIKSLIFKSISSEQYGFLNHYTIRDFLDFDLADLDAAYFRIQELIDRVLDTKADFPVAEERTIDILIEDNTEYSQKIHAVELTLNGIREIAVEKCRLTGTDLNGRGVTPLETEEELFIYLYRYGLMHQAKLNHSFDFFPFSQLDKKISLIDWGCGQGLASIAFNDYLRDRDLELSIANVTLIEPSPLSLKRAALHVTSSMTSINNLYTICRSFDDLSEGDFKADFGEIKIHLFSNVLDIDEAYYSQIRLINLIKSSQTGTNYFICSSPYINDFKTNRIDNFVQAFRDESNFQLFNSIDSRRGEWIGNWTIASRIFKVSL